MHHNSLSEEEFFSEYYADAFSNSPSDICTSVSEDDSSSECSSDSDSVSNRPTKRQNTLVTDSEMESKKEIHSAGECSFASTEEWIEDSISWKLEDFRGVSGITTECNKQQSISEMTELIVSQDKNQWPQVLVSAKSPLPILSKDLVIEVQWFGSSHKFTSIQMERT